MRNRRFISDSSALAEAEIAHRLHSPLQSNLVMNGIEAMTGVVGERRVLTTGGQRDELDGRPAVRITVQDLGSGIEPKTCNTFLSRSIT